ncbi:MAG: FadR/GntR family transcriptional regulator [Chloroflexota bacterium]
MSTSGDLYRSVDGVGARESVVRRIEDLILENKLAPGNPLPPERELAARLSVSRNVLREGLRILSQKGLVRVVAGRGAYVEAPSGRVVSESLALLLQLRQVTLLELCDARLLIEPELASLAAQRASMDDVAAIDACLAELARTSSEPHLHVSADLTFHNVIASVARHSVYGAIVEAVRAPMAQSMLLGTQIPRAIDISDGHHRAITAAIRAHDPDAAHAAMWGHIAYVQNYVRRRSGSAPLAAGESPVACYADIDTDGAQPSPPQVP